MSSAARGLGWPPWDDEEPPRAMPFAEYAAHYPKQTPSPLPPERSYMPLAVRDAPTYTPAEAKALAPSLLTSAAMMAAPELGIPLGLLDVYRGSEKMGATKGAEGKAQAAFGALNAILGAPAAGLRAAQATEAAAGLGNAGHAVNPFGGERPLIPWAKASEEARAEYLGSLEGIQNPIKRATDPVSAAREGVPEVPLSLRNMAQDVAPETPRPTIKAYHGSPHDFDRFDLSKIGTGDGKQVFGHGLYFSEDPNVARAYRDPHGAGRIEFADGAVQPYKGLKGADEFAYRSADEYSGDFDRALADLDEPATPGTSESTAQMYRDAAVRLRDWQAHGAKIVPGGHAYEVKISAGPDEFLDMDAPLGGQSERVRSAIEGVLGPQSGDALGRKGQSFFYDVGATKAGPDESPYEVASRVLGGSGVKGTKFGAGGEGGAQNYVVFDDSLVDIMRKYGLAGLAAGGLAGNRVADR